MLRNIVPRRRTALEVAGAALLAAAVFITLWGVCG